MGETERMSAAAISNAIQSALEAMEHAEILIGQLRIEVEYWKQKALQND
jgi:hypothetical protein